VHEDAAHLAVFISGTGHGIGCATAEKLLHYAASIGTPLSSTALLTQS